MSTANWSELPNDVLGYLIDFLALPDYYRFGAVCRNWSTVAREKHHRPAQQLPWLVLGEDIATKKHIFFNISDNKHYYIDIPELHGQFVCGSSFGWLFTVDDALNFRMLNPFTRKSYNLPPLDFVHQIPITWNKKWLVHKVILDHDPNERSNFTVIILDIYYEVAFWKQGDSTWTSAVLPYSCITDIIFCKGQFYAIGFNGQLQVFVVDVVPDLKLIPLEHHVPIIDGSYKSLVDFNGELLLLQWEREMVEGMYKEMLPPGNLILRREFGVSVSILITLHYLLVRILLWLLMLANFQDLPKILSTSHSVSVFAAVAGLDGIV